MLSGIIVSRINERGGAYTLPKRFMKLRRTACIPSRRFYKNRNLGGFDEINTSGVASALAIKKRVLKSIQKQREHPAGRLPAATLWKPYSAYQTHRRSSPKFYSEMQATLISWRGNQWTSG